MNVQYEPWQDDTETGYLAGEFSEPETWELEDFSDLVPAEQD